MLRIIIGSYFVKAIIFFAFTFVFSTTYFSAYARTDLGPDNVSNNNHHYIRSESQTMSILDNINNSGNSNTTSTLLNTPVAGSLQIPYSGLVTMSMSPSVAEILGLNSTTRGKLVTHIIPGSPAERASIQASNFTTDANTEEKMAPGGDIIFAVDGSTAYATAYDDLEQYIYEDKRVGENITLTILRDGQVKDVELTIGAMPRFLWYENTDEGIKMKYPSDWTVSYGPSVGGIETVEFLSIEKTALRNASAATVSVSKHLSNSTDGSNLLKPNVMHDVSDVRILNTGITSLDDMRGYFSIFYDYSQTNHTLKVLTVFAIKDLQLYRIDFVADPRRYNDYLPLVTEMINSFQFIGP